MNSKIEQAINDLEDYIETCRNARFQSGYILVNKEEIESMIAELRLKTPEEIKRYQKIISNKEQILADARTKADEIIAQANVKKEELVSEHQIMQNAYSQADEVVNRAKENAVEILNRATSDANEIRTGAIDYTDDCLRGIEQLLANSIDASKSRYEALVAALEVNYKEVIKNRSSLKPMSDDVVKALEEESEQT